MERWLSYGAKAMADSIGFVAGVMELFNLTLCSGCSPSRQRLWPLWAQSLIRLRRRLSFRSIFHHSPRQALHDGAGPPVPCSGASHSSM
jgi:hypothetical protein